MAEKKAVPKETKGAGGKRKLILIVLILLLVVLAGAGAGAYFLFFRSAGEGEPQATDEAHATQEAHEAPAAHGEPGAVESAPLIYHPLDPVTVNLGTPGPVRFLRISIILVTRDDKVIAAVDHHLPMIRNDLLNILAAQEFAVINTTEGKAKLREDLKKMMTGLLIRSSEPSGIEDILFTDLVMQ